MKILSIIFLILGIIAASSHYRPSSRRMTENSGSKWKISFKSARTKENAHEWRPVPSIISFWLLLAAYVLLFLSK